MPTWMPDEALLMLDRRMLMRNRLLVLDSLDLHLLVFHRIVPHRFVFDPHLLVPHRRMHHDLLLVARDGMALMAHEGVRDLANNPTPLLDRLPVWRLHDDVPLWFPRVRDTDRAARFVRTHDRGYADRRGV